MVISRTVAANSKPGPSKMMDRLRSNGGRCRMDQVRNVVCGGPQKVRARSSINLVGPISNVAKVKGAGVIA